MFNQDLLVQALYLRTQVQLWRELLLQRPARPLNLDWQPSSSGALPSSGLSCRHPGQPPAPLHTDRT
jgi:hypothetical protein